LNLLAVVKALTRKRKAVTVDLAAAGLMVVEVEQGSPEETEIRHQPLHLRVTMAARVSRQTARQTAQAAEAQVN
jgi:hypothetical protein